jgi:hypothetical protein
MKITQSLKSRLLAIAFSFAMGGQKDLSALADALEAIAQEARAQSK